MRKRLILFLAIALSTIGMAQNTETEKKGMPNIPGTFLFDYGFNFLSTHRHDTLKTKWFPSNVINAYYLYEFKIDKKGQFTFNPGVGVGVDKLAFKDNLGVFSVVDPTSGNRQTVVMPLINVFPNASGYKKTKLAMTYIDVPMEIRFHTNPDDRNRSFKLAVGGRLGVLVNQKTKVKYTTVPDADGEQQKIKVKSIEDFGVNRFRYGTTVRMGIGFFNIFYYHNFSSLFSGKNGPDGTQVSNYSIGLTISGF